MFSFLLHCELAVLPWTSCIIFLYFISTPSPLPGWLCREREPLSHRGTVEPRSFVYGYFAICLISSWWPNKGSASELLAFCYCLKRCCFSYQIELISSPMQLMRDKPPAFEIINCSKQLEHLSTPVQLFAMDVYTPGKLVNPHLHRGVRNLNL